MLYIVQATVLRVKDSGTVSDALPSFYLDTDADSKGAARNAVAFVRAVIGDTGAKVMASVLPARDMAIPPQV